jgi:hypothetical protein
MFPTSHDIFPEILDESITVLRKVLEAGNSVLITTKPHFDSIKRICTELSDYKDQICFRFTITSVSDTTLMKYEPDAPLFIERLNSVRYAYQHNYTTSLSIEPFLSNNPVRIVESLAPYIDDTIWIGIMSGTVPDQLKPYYTETNLEYIIMALQGQPDAVASKIRLKDSIVNKLALPTNKIKNNLPEGLTPWLAN